MKPRLAKRGNGIVCDAADQSPACRQWVKLRKAHCEQMLSGLPLTADTSDRTGSSEFAQLPHAPRTARQRKSATVEREARGPPSAAKRRPPGGEALWTEKSIEDASRISLRFFEPA